MQSVLVHPPTPARAETRHTSCTKGATTAFLPFVQLARICARPDLAHHLHSCRPQSHPPLVIRFEGFVIQPCVIRIPPKRWCCHPRLCHPKLALSDHFGSVTAMPSVTANRKTEGFICPLCDTAIPGDATAVRSRICRTTQYAPRVMTDTWEPICRPCAQSGSFVLGAIPEGAKSWRRAVGKDHDPDGELCVCVTCRRSVILRRDGRRVAPMSMATKFSP